MDIKFNQPDTKLPKMKKIKTYRALLTQDGTDAPIATELQNELGGSLTFGRSGQGLYTAELLGYAFPIDKTTVVIGQGFVGEHAAAYVNVGGYIQIDTVVLTTGAPTDYRLYNTMLEILVYE